jgi:hypothetical protein
MRVGLLVLALVAIAAAGDKPNPSDFPDQAHVVSAVFTHTTAPSNVRTTEIQIGSKIFVADSICKAATVGSDYPARREGSRIKLLVGQKVCKYRVVGEREAAAR